MISRLLGLFSSDMAIDLGTANTLVYARGRGVVLNEPSVVAVADEKGKSRILAVGEQAKRMIGRTHGNIRAVRPMRGGVIADFAVAGELIKHLIREIHSRGRFTSPRVVVTVPSGSTAVERRSVREAAEAAGARRVYLIEEAIASAIGAGLPVTEARGSMIVDIGGGTTEVAVLSLGGIVSARSVGVGGRVMDEAIVACVRRAHNVLIGDTNAEEIKHEIGAAKAPSQGEGRSHEVRGRDLMSGVPCALTVSELQIASGLAESVGTVIETVKTVLERTAPELAADIVDTGIALTGGGALLGRMADVLEEATGLQVTIAEEPLLCGVKGAGRALDEMRRLKSVVVGT